MKVTDNQNGLVHTYICEVMSAGGRRVYTPRQAAEEIQRRFKVFVIIADVRSPLVAYSAEGKPFVVLPLRLISEEELESVFDSLTA